MPSLDGQVAIVTGARRGLGRSHALELARMGAAVVVNGRPGSDGLDAVAEEIVAGGGRAIASQADVSTRAGGKEAVEAALAEFGRLDVLVNNAGILRTGYFEELDDRHLDDIFDIHLKSLFYVTQPAFTAMRERGYGRIVTTGSNTAFGMYGLAAYAAAKAGVMGLTRALGSEGEEHGILVNSVMPNAATPAMEHDPIPGFENDKPFAEAFEAVADRFRTDLVSPLVGFLASPACTTTGDSYSALGGRFSRVFYGVGDGWTTAEDKVRAEDIKAHIEEIRALEPFSAVESTRHEYQIVAEQQR
jgi:NAD(P)-dependent dehydrogenase (short-subunit alcohol dehydrogenase family)